MDACLIKNPRAGGTINEADKLALLILIKKHKKGNSRK